VSLVPSNVFFVHRPFNYGVFALRTKQRTHRRTVTTTRERRDGEYFDEMSTVVTYAPDRVHRNTTRPAISAARDRDGFVECTLSVHRTYRPAAVFTKWPCAHDARTNGIINNSVLGKRSGGLIIIVIAFTTLSYPRYESFSCHHNNITIEFHGLNPSVPVSRQSFVFVPV